MALFKATALIKDQEYSVEFDSPTGEHVYMNAINALASHICILLSCNLPEITADLYRTMTYKKLD